MKKISEESASDCIWNHISFTCSS